MAETAETIPFQAETARLLRLVVHSLYKNREIFLRELVSNASDALDKLRFESLTRPELLEGDERLAIRLEPDSRARTLSVTDTGIGMTRDEVVSNLGTIARSGTLGFLEELRSREERAADPPELPPLIGQFGVGFYSSFIVADEVVVETRRAGEAKGVRWRSRGEGGFEVEEVERAERGTRVTLHLKAPEPEADEEDARLDFTSEPVLRALVKRYSDFVEYPIEMEVEREEGEGDERKSVRRVEVLNSRRPLWTRPKDEIEEREYAEFYHHVSHDWNDPLRTVHLKAEGTLEYTALLYLPRVRPLDLLEPTHQAPRVQLYVRRVFVMGDCEDLLPPWLRFVRGVVDAADLPLNVSRETLQENRQVRQIRRHLTRKILDELRSMLDSDREGYAAFWRAFGPILKEGLWADDEWRERLADLLVAESSRTGTLRTLSEVVGDMPVKQREIYVLPAQDAESARRSPLLEAFREKDREVLLLVDPVDEFVLQRLTEYEGRPIRRIDQGAIDLAEEDERRAREERAVELAPVLESVRKELADHVEEVRFSTRLKESPAVLVSSDHALSPHLERFLRATGQVVPAAKRVLELNPDHPLVERLRRLADEDFGRFADHCRLLHGQALLAEGSPLPDPARFSKLVADLMVREAAPPGGDDSP